MTSPGIEVPCLMVPENRKIMVKTPVIKLKGSAAFKEPRPKYPEVDKRFPKKIAVNI